MAEGGDAEPGERDRSSGPRPPSARDLQLALAELCEDEVKCKSSKSDRPKASVFKSPRTPPQRFYSSEHEYSGLHIARPSTGKIVNELFKEAREHGAVPLNEATRASGDDKSKSFTGGGYRLGNSFCEQSEYIYEESQLQDVQVLLKLWSNGFSLDDGELRPYNDPTNAQFLESVKRGEIPPELQRLVHGGQVNLDMEDHQDQEYIKPRWRFKAFSGEGQKLGRCCIFDKLKASPFTSKKITTCFIVIFTHCVLEPSLNIFGVCLCNIPSYHNIPPFYK
ncbi:UBX domain-containing protein 2B isoform X2 [Phyllostomus discolor]|uniref:UBX domain-containing protein 2B isoform X2 n=1 Tax=Phyllostomus discolor TaxID=89673 RepID=A0A7E6E608_9CHIR|nr:UBX domain-containing protein 2B isoform X2 [Phyllostomus discolor]